MAKRTVRFESEVNEIAKLLVPNWGSIDVAIDQRNEVVQLHAQRNFGSAMWPQVKVGLIGQYGTPNQTVSDREGSELLVWGRCQVKHEKSEGVTIIHSFDGSSGCCLAATFALLPNGKGTLFITNLDAR